MLTVAPLYQCEVYIFIYLNTLHWFISFTLLYFRAGGGGGGGEGGQISNKPEFFSMNLFIFYSFLHYFHCMINTVKKPLLGWLSVLVWNNNNSWCELLLPISTDCSQRWIQDFLRGCEPLRNSITNWWEEGFISRGHSPWTLPLHLPLVLHAQWSVQITENSGLPFGFTSARITLSWRAESDTNLHWEKSLHICQNKSLKVDVTSWSDLRNCNSKRILVIKVIVKNVLLLFKRQFLRADWDCNVGNNKHCY